jgi:hypothetical protein
MPNCVTMVRSIVSATLCYGALATAVEAQNNNQAAFLQSGQTATLNCSGGATQIMGSNNDLTVSGKCSALNVAGSGNKITIEFAPGASISLAGSNNAISWTGADGKKPMMSSVGSGNTVTPSLQ